MTKSQQARGTNYFRLVAVGPVSRHVFGMLSDGTPYEVMSELAVDEPVPSPIALMW